MSGTTHPPVAHSWRPLDGRFTTTVYARAHWRCRVCKRYFGDHVDFVRHLDQKGECHG